MIITLILISYLITTATWLFIAYDRARYSIITIGDLLDETATFMYIPVVNAAALFILAIAFLIHKLKLDTIWCKFRSIKLR